MSDRTTGRRVKIRGLTPPARRLAGFAAVLAAGLLLLAAGARTADAAGGESARRAHDLALMVDTRWAGGAHGGYYPVRIRVTSLTRARTLTFRFVDQGGSGSRLPGVERRIAVGSNATVQFTLAIPLVSQGSNGTLRVYDGGRELDQLTQHIALPDVDLSNSVRPALLVIHPSPASIDCGHFDAATRSAVAVGGAGGAYAYGYYGMRTTDSQTVAPAMLPEAWIEYSALDVVAIPLATLDALPPAVRAAILRWTEAGGTLLVTETGEPGEKSEGLARLLDLADRPVASRKWREASPGDWKRSIVARPAEPMGMPAAMEPAATKEVPWTPTRETFSHTEFVAGRVFAFPGNPFPGSAADWAWWMNAAGGPSSLSWTTRFGMSSRQRNARFFDFLIPGVGGVPAVAFVVLISIFTVIIGPVNYFVVLRRKQLYLLVFTIPFIAFVTSLSLLGYALIADGFSVQSRLRSMTFLDQRTKHAVSFNRISLFAGLSPSGGLRFSPETAVLPIWPGDDGFPGGTVDWTDTQALTSGWLHSRTRTQFETVAWRSEEGRVEFTPSGADGLKATNALPWKIDALIVRDEEGWLFAGRELPAGGSLELHPAGDEDFQLLAAPLSAAPLATPAGSEVDPQFRTSSLRRRMYGYEPPAFDSARSFLESGLRRLVQARGEPQLGGLAPRSYLATFRDNPGIELGVPASMASEGVHALLGYY